MEPLPVHTKQATSSSVISPADILTPAELAARLKVRRTWIYEKMRQRGDDPLPVLRCGRYLRFHWPSCSAWLTKNLLDSIRVTAFVYMHYA